MARRRQSPRSRQAPKSKKRPRWYHHGRAQGKVNERKIQRALPAFERAEADLEETSRRAAEARAELVDWQELLAGIERAVPAILAPIPEGP